MVGIDEQLLDVLLSPQASIECVARVTAGHGLEDLLNSEITQLAVVKAVEQVGEVSGRILRKFPDFAAAHPAFELTRAYGARNRLVHGYETLDFQSVWISATVSVPRMGRELRRFLNARNDRP